MISNVGYKKIDKEEENKFSKRISFCSLLKITFLTFIILLFFNFLYLLIVNSSKQTCDRGYFFKSSNKSDSKLGHVIINGNNAKHHNYPWIVSLWDQTFGHVCGGSIISDRWILTAAHCIDIEIDNLRVITGLHYLDTFNESQVYKIEKYFTYYNYTDQYSGDIALIKVDRKIEIDNETVSTIDISEKSSDTFTNKCLLTAGWGATEDLYDYKFADELKETYLTVIDDFEKCQIENNWEKDYVFCTKSSNTISKIICFGDSGGPLMSYDNEKGKWYVEGIATYVNIAIDKFGRRKCLSDLPGFFTKVFSYRHFILNITRIN